MELFNELEFKAHPIWSDAKQAKIRFDNGYGASIITGGRSYTTDKNPYELAVLYNEDFAYNTEITDNVVGHLNAEGVELILNKIKDLPIN